LLDSSLHLDFSSDFGALVYTRLVNLVSEKYLSNEDAGAIKSLPKIITGDVVWKNEPAGSRMFYGDFNCLNERQESIAGMTIELLFCRTEVKDECKFLFTVFQLKGTIKLRVYQIEVVPPGRSKHKEKGEKWYGPHQHVGEKAEKIAASASHLGCANHSDWFEYFLKETNTIHNGKWVDPDPANPQLELPI
jgi:hypothetical protein